MGNRCKVGLKATRKMKKRLAHMRSMRIHPELHSTVNISTSLSVPATRPNSPPVEEEQTVNSISERCEVKSEMCWDAKQKTPSHIQNPSDLSENTLRIPDGASKENLQDIIKQEVEPVINGVFLTDNIPPELNIGSDPWIPIEAKIESDDNLGTSNERWSIIDSVNNELEDSKPYIDGPQEKSSSAAVHFAECDMNSICRLCGSKLDQQECMQSDNDVFSYNYPDMILQCTSLTVLPGDGLPQKVCIQCISNLKKAYDFRNICISTLIRLLSQLTINNSLNTNLSHMKINTIEKIKTEPLNADNEDKCTSTDTQTVLNIGNAIVFYDNTNTQRLDALNVDSHQDKLEAESEELKNEQPIFDRTYLHRTRFNITKAKKDINKYVKQGGIEVLCPFCPVIFDVELYDEIELHLDSHLHIKQILECRYEECKETFTSPKKRNFHEGLDHGTQKWQECKLLCEHCADMLSRNTYKIHIKKNKYRKSECDLCSRQFKRKTNLRKHLENIHHFKRKSLKILQIQCKDCKEMVPENIMKYHRRNKHQPRITCSFCNKEFMRRNINGHLRTHTGEKPFSCVDCGLQFTFRVSLKTHRKKHHGDDIFTAHKKNMINDNVQKSIQENIQAFL